MNKGLRFFGALFLAAFVFSSTAYGQTEIGVRLNGELIDFENEPLIVNDRTMVPFREIFEHFEASVEWDGKERSVTAESEGKTVVLKIGSSDAVVDGKAAKLDSPPIIIGSRTYVPLRFIAEGLDAGGSWNGQTRTVSISTNATANLGDSWQEVGAKLGEPSVSLLSHYGFEWYVYNNDYLDYYQIGYREGKVAAIFTNASAYERNDGFKLGLTPGEAKNYFGTAISSIVKGNTYFMLPAGSHDTFKTEKSYVTLFYDEYDNRVAGIMEIAEDEEMKLDGYFGIPSGLLGDSYERQIFELANTERVKRGLSPLEWNQTAHDTAHGHSQDMALNGYYSHYDLLGQSPFERMSLAGINYEKAGENIAAGESNAFYVHYDWMNSLGHRTAILGDYDYIGVGVAFGGSYNAYYTQHFISF